MKFTEEQVGPIWDRTEGCASAWIEMEEDVKKDILSIVNTAVEQALEAAKGTPIEPKNIREGDRVRGVFLRSPDEDVVIEAVARVDKTAIGGMRIGSYGIGVLGNLRLIHRPAPPLKAGQVIRVDAATNAYTYIVGLEFYVLSMPDGSQFASQNVEMRQSTGSYYGVSPDAITAFTVLWPTEESK